MARIYDVSDPAFHADPFPVYRRLRDELPVYHDPERQSWVLSRFEDVHAAATNPETFSSHAPEADALLPMLNFLDGVRHRDLRALLSRGFTPARVARLHAFVESVVDDLLDRMAAKGGGDLVNDFGGPLASIVIGSLIGIPDARLEEFRHLTDDLTTVGQTGETIRLRTIAAAIYALFEDLLAERRVAPTDDLMSALLRAEVDGVRLTDDETLGFCFLLVSGGNDTTMNLISTGSVLLAENPEIRSRVANDPGLLPAAVEEMLRLEPPAQVHARTPVKEVILHGVAIPAQSRVLLLWGSANRDEREFPDPDVFDLERPNKRHLAFGIGPHFCLGAALARLEAQAAFRGLLSRWPVYRIGTPERLISPWARGFSSVPVELAAGA
jgi:cytochrome P450